LLQRVGSFDPRFLPHGERRRLLKEHESIFSKSSLIAFGG
jgi:hypothetical protein